MPREALHLSGELFLKIEGSNTFRLRWFELIGTHFDSQLRWSESEGQQHKGLAALAGAHVLIEQDERRGDEERFGFRLIPEGSRACALQASSAEERR